MILIMFSLFLPFRLYFMSKCEQCIARQLNAMRSMSKEQLKRITACKSTRVYKKGSIIFDERESLQGVYCIKKGACKLSKLSENGKDQTVKLIGYGELLGQRSVISDERTNLRAIAINDLEVCFIPKKEIINCLHENTEFSFDVMQQFAQDLKEAEDDLINMAQKTVKQRLAETLLYIERTFGTTENGFFNVILSREDYANIVGTATETVIRLLSQFKKEGYISTENKKIKINNKEALQHAK